MLETRLEFVKTEHTQKKMKTARHPPPPPVAFAAAALGAAVAAVQVQYHLHVPSVDYSLTNSKLLPQLYHLLLKKTGLVATQGWQAPPPQHATLPVGLYADGYQPCGRPNISTKISLNDSEGLWFPLAGFVPRCTDMISWLELPKIVDAEWVPKRAEALHALPSCTFKQHMRYQGVEYTTALRAHFGCITADHHHLWG